MNLVSLGSVRPRARNSQSIWDMLDREVSFGLPVTRGTYLVESIHLESKSIDSGHAAYRMKLRQFGSKVGIERHIVEILIRHFWLVSVLEIREGL